ncbi:MAG: GNAT family N-acetyltransferase [Proteocatella sp.]
MNFNYRLVDTLNKDKKEYIRFHNELFKSAGLDEVWIDWYHKQIPLSDERLSESRTYGLFDGNKLIGIWSVEPKIMFLRDRYIKVGRCFAVGVSEEYRRMGLFVKVSQYAIESEKKRGEFEYILGFPQTGRTVIGGHLKAGWEEIKYSEIKSVDLTQTDGLFFRNDVNQIFDFPKKNMQLGVVAFDETELYRNTRFLNHPKLQYMMFNYKDAYIILKTYSSFCHILELNGVFENVQILLEAAKSIAKRHGLSELNIWAGNGFKYDDILNKAGFKSGAQHGLPITMIAVKINATESLVIDEYNFGMGVEEGY